MTTIGFGDIVPKNLEERIIAIAIMVLSCFMFAYSVNSIGVLVNAIN
jgi:Ion channel